MTTLIQRMREDLVRRNYAESTIRSYLRELSAKVRKARMGNDSARRIGGRFDSEEEFVPYVMFAGSSC